jgi:hypothetical protein
MAPAKKAAVAAPAPESTEPIPEAPVTETAPIEDQTADNKTVKKTTRVQVPAKFARQHEALKTRFEKQSELVKKLKDEVNTLRSANSRVRRIPRPEAPAKDNGKATPAQ